MRKFLMFLMVLALAFTFAVPAFAFENIFGGYWRTRAYMDKNFTGEDQTEAADVTKVDTRTRLYYTAKFSDNFKFVNKFEMDATWGDASSGYGDIGADGIKVEVKNSYADMTFDKTNAKIGVQGATICRGFIFDDDFAGAVVAYKASDTLTLPFIWVKAYEGGYGKDANDYDFDYYAIYPTINLGKATVNPLLMYAYSKDASNYDNFYTNPIADLGLDLTKISVYYLGADVDANVGPASVWFTGIYEGGKVDVVIESETESVDVKAYLLALGAGADVDKLNVHGQVFYASGADDSSDYKGFWVPAGQSYYWAEIMGYGIFDNQVSNASCGDQISNIMALNLGASFKASDKLTLNGDLWFAQLAEDDANGNTDLGTEIDLTANYKLLDNVTLDVVAAYLVAGDATTLESDDEADPLEIGTRISFGF
ncbi:MAG TPA: hypothetical protein PLT09_02725 [Deltaproteobacteria bacterium]|nr:hypothetical protein [Deltaproteobacteria bacterium]HXK46328.1 hypothetical protein [Deltaproteobacteria bacterium]